jgi:hypothetical protein
MSPQSNDRIVSVERFVPADADAIFELLADPRQHATIDGSGTVKSAAIDAPERLFLGAKFGMSMKMGAPYRITNEVVEFEEGRRIGWRHMGGHIWRYLLEPVEGGTKVTEQFDWGPSKAPWLLKLMRVVGKNERSMQATLDRLVEHFSS